MSEPDAVPRLLLIADAFATGRAEMDAADVCRRACALVEAGVPFVMLRDHAADAATFAAAAGVLARDLRAVNPDVRLVVNTHVAVALALGAGVHVGRRGPGVAEAVAAGVASVGVSAHSATQARTAAKAGAAYVTLSPVFATATHPDVPPLGLGPLALAARTAGVPVLALGGLTPEHTRRAREAGAHGAAVLAALLFSWNAGKATREFLRAVDL